jgi:hypothetical protein
MKGDKSVRKNLERLAQDVHGNSQTWRLQRRQQLNALRKVFASGTYKEAVGDFKAAKRRRLQ